MKKWAISFVTGLLAAEVLLPTALASEATNYRLSQGN